MRCWDQLARAGRLARVAGRTTALVAYLAPATRDPQVVCVSLARRLREGGQDNAMRGGTSQAPDAPSFAAPREGLPLVIGVAALGGLLGVLDRRLCWLALMLALGILAFFRDPRRAAPSDDRCLYAAADGFVLAVDEVDEPWHLRGRALRIATFLTLFDVHVNRSPVAGDLVGTRYVPGGFAPALDRARGAENERQYLALDGPRGPVVVVQVAGLLARRIVRWVEPGDQLRAGQKLGMIKFGSRTDVLAPFGQVEALVQPGARVKAGVTPIARYRRPGAE